jgi:hypothetical protein
MPRTKLSYMQSPLVCIFTKHGRSARKYSTIETNARVYLCWILLPPSLTARLAAANTTRVACTAHAPSLLPFLVLKILDGAILQRSLLHLRKTLLRKTLLTKEGGIRKVVEANPHTGPS